MGRENKKKKEKKKNRGEYAPEDGQNNVNDFEKGWLVFHSPVSITKAVAVLSSYSSFKYMLAVNSVGPIKAGQIE